MQKKVLFFENNVLLYSEEFVKIIVGECEEYHDCPSLFIHYKKAY